MPIVSIGNISVGGTGKSVMVAFLVENFSIETFGIIVRGYKAVKTKNEVICMSRKGKNHSFFELDYVGDEALMHAMRLDIPVFVARRRKKALELAEKINRKGVFGFYILDDAYQHVTVASTCSILIMDGRKPFENGWTLPAGLLREYDYSRADIIIISHAKTLSTIARETLIKSLNAVSLPILFGYHVISGFKAWSFKNGFFSKNSLKDEAVIIVAGIGSYAYFVETVIAEGAIPYSFFEYEDHYTYSLEDIKAIMHAVRQGDPTVIVTTEKDWVKLYPLLLILYQNSIGFPDTSWVVVTVSFSFTYEYEQRIFTHYVKKKLQQWYLKNS